MLDALVSFNLGDNINRPITILPHKDLGKDEYKTLQTASDILKPK